MKREIFAPFNCYLDILLALRNYSWISGLPLIEATNLLREETNRVPAQQAHTLISLTNSVPLYNSDNFISSGWKDISVTQLSPEKSHWTILLFSIYCEIPQKRILGAVWMLSAKIELWQSWSDEDFIGAGGNR